jgi:DNA mismatch endonuclease (patch repair protein)
MTDVFSKEKRSEIMAGIRGKGNRSTEWRLRARLIAAGISGWRINATDITGKPDFVFDEAKIAIFVDGCFWHGCRRCRNIPTTNTDFWSAKIEATIKRDQKVMLSLSNSGWRVLRFWEHELKQQPKECITIIQTVFSWFGQILGRNQKMR